MLPTLRKIFYIAWHKELFELLGKLDFLGKNSGINQKLLCGQIDCIQIENKLKTQK